MFTALTDLLLWSLIWLQALSKALTEDELIYLRAQFKLLEPENGRVSLSNFKAVSWCFHSVFAVFFLSIFLVKNLYLFYK